MNKRLGIFLMIFILFTLPVSASMVSILLVETGIPQETQSGRYSSLWEGGIMNAFFDAGHIVTNGPIARMEKVPTAELNGPIEDDFYEAIYSGADYFVVGFLEFQAQGNRAVPKNIWLRIYSTDSGKMLYQSDFPAGSGRNLDEEYRIAQNAGRVIVSKLEG